MDIIQDKINRLKEEVKQMEDKLQELRLREEKGFYSYYDEKTEWSINYAMDKHKKQIKVLEEILKNG